MKATSGLVALVLTLGGSVATAQANGRGMNLYDSANRSGAEAGRQSGRRWHGG